MDPRKWINKWWIALPLLMVGALILYRQSADVWNARSEQFRGAVLGVIGAATAGLLVYLLSRYWDRRRMRHNALCYIEQTLNSLLNDLNDNQWQIDLACKTDEPTLVFPVPLNITEQDIKDIGRAELKNKLMRVLTDCKKYSHSLTSAIAIDEKNRSTFRDFEAKKFAAGSENIRAIFRDFHRQFKIHLKQIYAFGKLVDQSILEALVDTRFFVRNDQPPLVGLVPYYSRKELTKWRVEARKQLEQEIENSRAADEARRRPGEAA